MVKAPFNDHDRKCFIIRLICVIGSILMIPVGYFFYYRHSNYCSEGSKYTNHQF